MSTATLTRPTRSRATSQVAVLRSRAADLRTMAVDLEGPLAFTYRRRAAELELQATALAARLGIDETPVLAA